MQSISLYFDKYKNIGLESRVTKNVLKEVLKEFAGVEIDSKEISFQKQTIVIKISGSAKSAILIKKEKIQEEFLKRLGEYGFKTQKKII